jgi:hypothetical protein
MSDRPLEQRIAECGKQMAIAALPAYSIDGAVHPPTLVAGCARMAGFYLLRSFALATPAGARPGDAVLSAQASERTPVLVRTCAGILARLGHAIPAAPPEPLIDEATTPREAFLETQGRLQPLFDPLATRFALDDYQAARAAAVAAALTAHTVRERLTPPRGLGLAAFAFAEGSRTVPAQANRPGLGRSS